MLIGVVGFNGSGKDTVAQYLAKNYGFAHKDLGQEIRDRLKEMGKNHLDRNEMISLGNEMRKKFGFNYWCKNAIGSSRSGNIIITSIRNPSEVDEIKSRKGFIIEVFADQMTRFERTSERVRMDPDSHGAVQSFEKFKEMEEIELKSDDPSKQQLLKCIEMADYRLDNNRSFEYLYSEIKKVLSELEKAKLEK